MAEEETHQHVRDTDLYRATPKAGGQHEKMWRVQVQGPEEKSRLQTYLLKELAQMEKQTTVQIRV